MAKAFLFAVGLSFLAPVSAFACAACYGQSDAPMAQGMNWGILSLLAVIVCMLAGVAGFFVFLAKRAAKLPAVTVNSPLVASTERI